MIGKGETEREKEGRLSMIEIEMEIERSDVTYGQKLEGDMNRRVIAPIAGGGRPNS